MLQNYLYNILHVDFSVVRQQTAPTSVINQVWMPWVIQGFSLDLKQVCIASTSFLAGSVPAPVGLFAAFADVSQRAHKSQQFLLTNQQVAWLPI